jgi:hypothetical protein
MNTLLGLDDDTREQYILALPDIADVITLERTHPEFRDWIQTHDIYHRWERKHLGKTDKWRTLLFQELGVKRKHVMFFKHVAYSMSVHIENKNGKFTTIFNLINMAHTGPFLEIEKKFRHYLHTMLWLSANLPTVRQKRATVDDTHGASIGFYYFMYDLLRFGFQYISDVNMNGGYDAERLIREPIGEHQCNQGDYQCSECAVQFCGDAACPDWVGHECQFSERKLTP